MIAQRVEIRAPVNDCKEGYWCETIYNADKNEIQLIVILDTGKIIQRTMPNVKVIAYQE